MPIKTITPGALKTRLDAGEDILVVDVRMPYELEMSRLDFAEHIILDELPDRTAEIPTDKPVVFVCRSGGRSMQAAMFMAAEGWNADHLYNLEGGILAWAQAIDPSLPSFY